MHSITDRKVNTTYSDAVKASQTKRKTVTGDELGEKWKKEITEISVNEMSPEKPALCTENKGKLLKNRKTTS